LAPELPSGEGSSACRIAGQETDVVDIRRNRSPDQL